MENRKGQSDNIKLLMMIGLILIVVSLVLWYGVPKIKSGFARADVCTGKCSNELSGSPKKCADVGQEYQSVGQKDCKEGYECCISIALA